MVLYNPAFQGPQIFQAGAAGSSTPAPYFYTAGLFSWAVEAIQNGLLQGTVVTTLPATGAAGQIVCVEDTGLAAFGPPVGNMLLMRWDVTQVPPSWQTMLGSPGAPQWGAYFAGLAGGVTAAQLLAVQTLAVNAAIASALAMPALNGTATNGSVAAAPTTPLGIVNKGYVDHAVALAAQRLDFIQAAPSTSWVITHNFGNYPLVQFWDSTRTIDLDPAVNQVTVNQLVATFLTATAGLAVLEVAQPTTTAATRLQTQLIQYATRAAI